MRLTDDQIKMARITYTKVVQDDFILDLIDTIEALQQENEQLQAQLESLRCTSCGEIPATIGTDDGQYCEKCAEELDAVEMIDLFNYHNPADMEALEKAKNILLALENRMSSGQWPAAGTCEKCGCEISYKFHRFCHTCMHVEVITAIKALGGREYV